MIAALTSFLALFVAVFCLMTGVGLLGTYLSLRLTIEGFSAQTTGWVMSAYFLGLVSGSRFVQGLILRIGHIRAFATFAATATAIVMLHGLVMNPLVWAALRFLTGIATMGLYTVIESWLNECTPAHSRGRVFSMYMILTYLGMGIGQQLLNLGDIRGPDLFFVAGFVLALCLVPVAVTHGIHPELPQPLRYKSLSLFRRAPLGILGCFTAGLINSAFYTMGPVFGSAIGLSASALSWFMSAAIFGGLIFQWPVGAVSDRFDRTAMLAALSFIIACFSGLLYLVAFPSGPVQIGAMMLFGGLIFALYPIAVARTHDLFEPEAIVPVSAVLLLFYGIGATMGPVAASQVIALSGRPHGLFLFCAAASGVYAAVAFHFRRKARVEFVPVDDQVSFKPMNRTSAVVLQIDPRGEAPQD